MSGSAQPAKSHSSALCLIPERSVWSQLQEVRCFKDKVQLVSRIIWVCLCAPHHHSKGGADAKR